MSDQPESPDHLEDRRLVTAAAEGDESAFSELVRRKRERVFWIAYRIVGDREDARDIAQATFIRLWKVIGRYRPEWSFDTWLYRITVNLAIDLYRSKGPSRLTVPLPGAGEPEPKLSAEMPRAPGPFEDLTRSELGAVFEEIASRLGEKQRAVFVLSQIEGMATEEIAEVMNISHSTVRNHLFQARRALQDSLKRLYPEYFRAGRGGTKDDRER